MKQKIDSDMDTEFMQGIRDYAMPRFLNSNPPYIRACIMQQPALLLRPGAPGTRSGATSSGR